MDTCPKSRINPEEIRDQVMKKAYDEYYRINSSLEKFKNNLNKNTKKDIFLTSRLNFIEPFTYIPQVINIGKILTYLIDYHAMVKDSKQKQLAILVLEDISSILYKYFYFLQNLSSIVSTVESAFLFEDSEKFLEPYLERLTAICEEYMEDNDSIGTNYVIKIYLRLFIHADKIESKFQVNRKTYIFTLIRSKINLLIMSAGKLSNIDGLRQLILVNEKIGILAIQKKYIHEFKNICEDLDLIADYALKTSFKNILLKQIIKSYLLLYKEYVYTEKHVFYLTRPFENMKIIIFKMCIISNEIQDKNKFYMIDPDPYYEFIFILKDVVEKVNGTSSLDKKRKLKKIFLEVAKDLRTLIEYITDNIKNIDYIFLHHFAVVIRDSTFLMMNLSNNPEWSDYKEFLLDENFDYLTQPNIFSPNVNRISSNVRYESITEILAEIGLKTLTNGLTMETKFIVEDISNFALEIIEKEDKSRYDFPESTIMLHICFIGILAIKVDNKKVYKHVKQYIWTFQNRISSELNLKNEKDNNTFYLENKLIQMIQKMIDEKKLYDEDQSE